MGGGEIPREKKGKRDVRKRLEVGERVREGTGDINIIGMCCSSGKGMDRGWHWLCYWVLGHGLAGETISYKAPVGLTRNLLSATSKQFLIQEETVSSIIINKQGGIGNERNITHVPLEVSTV